MQAFFIAVILLIVAVGAIYLLLKSMGEDGIEVAAPGSCKSGRCGVRTAPVNETSDAVAGNALDDAGETKRKEIA